MTTKVHVILQSFVVSTWMHDTIELVQHVTLWNLNSFSSHLRLVWSTALGLLGQYAICMHQHSTSGIRRRRRRRRHSTYWHISQCEGVGWLLWWFALIQKKPWYKGEKCDNKEWVLNYEHPFPWVSRYWRVSDIMEVDITEFTVY